MIRWKDCGMSFEELVEEYVHQKKSLSQICKERGISKGCEGLSEMSYLLKRAGYEVRNNVSESIKRRKITKDNLEERLGISWDELVGWYNARKPLSTLCAKHGLSTQRSSVLKKLLLENNVLTDDPLRGYGFTEDELVNMYSVKGMSMEKICKKYNLGRAAERVVSSTLRKRGVHKWWKNNGFRSSSLRGSSKYIASDGYVRVYVTPNNCKLTNIPMGSHEMEHRLVVAASIGRPLKRNEWVHHINRDTTDNRLSNLMLVDKITHKRIHISMDKVIEELFREGMVAMDKDKKYVIRESDEYTRGFTDGMQAILEME